MPDRILMRKLYAEPQARQSLKTRMEDGESPERFAIWLLIGLAVYLAYGYAHSTLRRGSKPGSIKVRRFHHFTIP